MIITKTQFALLEQIQNSDRYPLVCLELYSSKDRSLRSTALEHVRLEDPHEPMEVIKHRAALLEDLMEQGMVLADYQLSHPVLTDYEIYAHSDVYALLVQTAAEARTHEEFLFDTPHIQPGLLRLTKRGRNTLRRLQHTIG